MSDERGSIEIQPFSIAERLKRPRLRFRLLAFLLFIGGAGMAIGTLGTMLIRSRSQGRIHDADLAALQGTWDLESSFPTLVIRGERFDFLPKSPSFARADGVIKIDVKASPKTIDLLGRSYESGEYSRMTFSYSIEGDTLTLQPISFSPAYGPASGFGGDARSLIAKRVSARTSGKGIGTGTPAR